MRDLRTRTLKAGCILAALFSVLLSATPALAQTVTAMWDASPPADQVTGYQVCIGTSSLSCNVALASKSAGTTSHTFSPTPGVRHYVAIRANNAAGSGPYSSEVSFSIPSFAQPANQSGAMGVAITPLNLSITDPDGSPLTITHTGLPVGLSINSVTRQITGIPVAAGAYTVTLFVNDGLVTVSRLFTWFVTSARPTQADFDGDSRADVAVYRPTTGTWFILQSSANATSWIVKQWGMSGDMPVPGDYDGDGKTDMAVYRPSNGTWYLLKSSTNFTSWIVYQWGIDGDMAVPGDYDGDGKTDMAVYRPSNGTWYLLRSSTNFASWIVYQWGIAGDTPTPGDYDGDGKTDMAVYRPSNGTWYLLKSSTNLSSWTIYQWGIGGDTPVFQGR